MISITLPKLPKYNQKKKTLTSPQQEKGQGGYIIRGQIQNHVEFFCRSSLPEAALNWIVVYLNIMRDKFMVKDEKLRDEELLWNRVQIDWLIDWLIDLNSERLLKLLIQDFFLNWVILLKLFREISSSDIPQRIFTEREITVTWMQ